MNWVIFISMTLLWIFVTLLRISYDLKSINNKLSNIKVECHVKNEEDYNEKT